MISFEDKKFWSKMIILLGLQPCFFAENLLVLVRNFLIKKYLKSVLKSILLYFKVN